MRLVDTKRVESQIFCCCWWQNCCESHWCRGLELSRGRAGAVQDRAGKIRGAVIEIEAINQGLSKHQEVSFTPVMKVEKFIVIFCNLFGAI